MLAVTGRVTSCNSGAQPFKGYTEAEILGQHFSRLTRTATGRRGCPSQAALDMLEARPEVDIEITDYLMPGMNGLQLAARMRAQRPDPPILIASAYGDLSPRT